jgi:phage FluMu protein Com
MHKMTIVCPCGTKLRVSMEHYLKMRCPKCQLMLKTEIERQAARNSTAILEITALILHERMTARRWTHNDEKISRLLTKHELVSHGLEYPPKQAEAEVPFDFAQEPPPPPVYTIPTVPPPIASAPAPAPEPKVKKVTVKLKKGRR